MPHGDGPARILVVDDHPRARGEMRRLFEAAAFEVVGEAADGREAVQLFEELSPDVTTMDLVMPRLNGVEAARAILARTPAALVVPVSALSHPSVQAACLEAGMFGFVSKPVDPEELLEEVREALRWRLSRASL